MERPPNASVAKEEVEEGSSSAQGYKKEHSRKKVDATRSESHLVTESREVG